MELIAGNISLIPNETYTIAICTVVLFVDVGDNRAILDNLSFSFVS